jgi:hypothetical protein
MLAVYSQCYICGNVIAIKYLRTKRMKGLKSDKKSDKIQVCLTCEKKLEFPQGIK